jgi:hypothetical protein
VSTEHCTWLSNGTIIASHKPRESMDMQLHTLTSGALESNSENLCQGSAY